MPNPSFAVVQQSKVIIKPNRQRKEFEADAMQELFQSIEKIGLMQAPVMRVENGELVLVAGERRFRTMKDMHDLGVPIRYCGIQLEHGCIPYTLIGNLSELEAEEAELDENMKRKDLTWQEQAAAVDRLMKLRQKQFNAAKAKVEAEVAEAAAAAQEPGQPMPATSDAVATLLASMEVAPPTVASITRELNPEATKGKANGELGSLADATRKQLIVAQHLDNPLIAKAKSPDEAFKILKKQEEAEKNKALAISVGASFNASVHKAFNISCLEWMSDPANKGTFDVILTDPPYGMGADKFGDAGGKLTGIEHHYDDSYESWVTLMAKWCALSYDVCKPQAHAYVFCDIDRFHELKLLMQAAGWYVFRTPLIVHKLGSGRVPLPDQGPRRQYEILLYAIKGNKPVTHIYPDVIASQADDNMSHGAQKPVGVYQNLLQRSVRPGDVVADFFSGSGTIFPACHGMKVTAYGFEINPEYYGMGLKRLQDLEIVEALSE
jgi:DNA modification methylase/ParB-like chromosome segregation protein Spo0J